MRIVVVGGTVSADDRIAIAAAGLALRGHDVRWLGAVPAAFLTSGVEPVGLRALPALRAEVVIGADAPRRLAIAAWLSGAEAMVLTTTSERAGRWGFLDRFAWSATASLALATDHDAHALVDGPRGLARERVGLWPDGTPGTTPDAAHPDTEVLERAGERTLAGHRAKRPRPAVFVDRDGTLIREEGYLSDPRKVEVLPGVARGLRALLDAGIPVVVATNQSGIGRGYYTAESVYEVMAVMRRMLRAEGVELTAIYLCPHAPGAGCPCRKPRPGLLERAAEDLVLDLPGSVMIGDKLSDVATGHHAGSRGVLVRTGYGAAEESAAHGAARAPDAVVDDVGVAAEWVLERS